MNINQSGFGAVETLLIIVMAGLIGGSGYYALQHQQAKNRVNTSKAADAKHSLVLFTDPSKSYTFSYPKNWIVKTPKPIKDWSDDEQLTWISYPGAPEPDLLNVSFDKTPKQVTEQTALLEDDAKDDPEAYETIYINGYTTLHQSFEVGSGKRIDTKEDRYLVIDKDQSSLYFFLTSKSHDDELGTNYDVTTKLSDFMAIIHSTKFL